MTCLTSPIRALWESKYLSLLEPTPEGRHYSGGADAAVIFGGGWAGSSIFNFFSNRLSSGSGSVWWVSTSSRSSVVGRCTSIICTAANFSSTLRGVSPGARHLPQAGSSFFPCTIVEMPARLVSPADRHEVIDANPLNDEKLARAIGLAVRVMRRLRRYRAAVARQQPVDVAWRSRLDHDWPLQANKTVADLAVVMPWYALSGGKAQHLDAQIRTLGNQLAACDRVIAAVARLHRLVPSCVPATLEAISRVRVRFSPLLVPMAT